jgi:hypothetical protein
MFATLLTIAAATMTRDELTENFQGAVLFYLDSLNETARWTDDLSTVCSVGYEWVGSPPSRQAIIVNGSWLPDPVAFPEPTIDMLLVYDLADVEEFYTDNYENPATIQSYQHWAKFTSAEIAACYVDAAMDGWVIWDTTLRRLRYYNHGTTSWVTY